MLETNFGLGRNVIRNFENILDHLIHPIASRKPPVVIGAETRDGKIILYFHSSRTEFGMAESSDAVAFEAVEGAPAIKNCLHLQRGALDLGHFSLMNIEDKGLAISFAKKPKFGQALHFLDDELKVLDLTNAVLVSDYQINGLYLMLLGGKRLRMATSKNGYDWNIDPSLQAPIQIESAQKIQIDLAQVLSTGLLICYRFVKFDGRRFHHQVHMALLNKNDPARILWRSPVIFEESSDWGHSSFGSAVVFRSAVYSFWNSSRQGIVMVRYPIEGLPFDLPRDIGISLEKSKMNPVINPRGEFGWESFATYNPAAFQADGRIHILYRAQGHDLLSSIGYASSTDGVTIDERSERPIYQAQEVFERFQQASPEQVEQKYVSGGGIAGCEDPRVTLMGDRVFMTYVAFDGASPPRVALTSIDLQDFLAKRWLWERPVLISPPGIVDKSAVIFPEKVNGKYVIMHRIFPDILIDYVLDLNFDGRRWLETVHRIKPRENMWDSRKVGAGAPPIKTADGWLLIYYGVDDRDDRQYKMGAMLLDLKDPSKVLYRSSTPILEPEDWYENSGFKPGVVYPCGAVLLGDRILVYYGGADCVVCVASRNLKDFIAALKSNQKLNLGDRKPVRMGKYAIHSKSVKPITLSRRDERVGEFRRV